MRHTIARDGIVAGILVPLATVLIDVKFRIDDPGNVIAIHLVGGLWGTLAEIGRAHV